MGEEHVPTVSWVFEIKHNSVGFASAGFPSPPGIGGSTGHYSSSPLTGHRSFVHRRGALAHHFADRFCHFDSSWSSAHQNSTISQQHISVLRIARGSLHACVLLALTRAHQSIALCAVALHGPIDCRLPEPSSPDAPCARSTRVVSFDAGSPDARPRASPRALAEASSAARTRARLRGPGSGGPARPRGPALPPQRTAVYNSANVNLSPSILRSILR